MARFAVPKEIEASSRDEKLCTRFANAKFYRVPPEENFHFSFSKLLNKPISTKCCFQPAPVSVIDNSCGKKFDKSGILNDPCELHQERIRKRAVNQAKRLLDALDSSASQWQSSIASLLSLKPSDSKIFSPISDRLVSKCRESAKLLNYVRSAKITETSSENLAPAASVKSKEQASEIADRDYDQSPAIQKRAGELESAAYSILTSASNIENAPEFSQTRLEYKMTINRKLQAETLVASYTPSAFPLAQLCVDLSTQQPDLMKVLLHLLLKRSPLCAPRYPRRSRSDTEAAFKLKMGYLQDSSGHLESEQAYNERSCGLVALFAAIVQATPIKPGARNECGIEHGWQWMAAILNMPPRTITPVVICAFLEVASYGLWKAYRDHFIQLVVYIRDVYIPRLPDGAVAQKIRLDLFIKDVFETGRPEISQPEGYLFE